MSTGDFFSLRFIENEFNPDTHCIRAESVLSPLLKILTAKTPFPYFTNIMSHVISTFLSCVLASSSFAFSIFSFYLPR